MKFDPRLKWIFYLSFSTLYLFGAAYWLIGLCVQSKIGIHPLQTIALQVHGMSGIWFLVLFGYLYAVHILPSLRRERHRRSGLVLWFGLLFLSLNVPFLYYLADESWRSSVIFLHTYVGLGIVIPLALHIGLAIKDRRATFRR